VKTLIIPVGHHFCLVSVSAFKFVESNSRLINGGLSFIDVQLVAFPPMCFLSAGSGVVDDRLPLTMGRKKAKASENGAEGAGAPEEGTAGVDQQPNGNHPPEPPAAQPSATATAESAEPEATPAPKQGLPERTPTDKGGLGA